MRKVLIGSAVILAVFAPLSASVAMADQPRPGATAGPGSTGHWESDSDQDGFLGVVDRDVEDKLHQDLDKRYGKHGAFQIPPLVLKPNSSGAFDANFPGGLSSNTSLNPAAANYGNSTAPVSASVTYTDGTRGDLPLESSNTLVAPAMPAGSPNIAAKPIDFSAINLTRQTPADQFFQVASLWLAALVVSAVGVGVTVGVRALRAARIERNGI